MYGIQTKKCSCCGVVKPITSFNTDNRRKDGYVDVCKDCSAKHSYGHKTKIEPIYHDDLSKFPPRMLMEHLSALGYKGNLQIPQNIVL